MKLTKEQFEDILTVGEAQAASQNKKITLELNYDTPHINVEEETDDDKKIDITYRYLGYIFEFRPKPERVSHGFSETTYQESEIFDYYDVKRGEKQSDAEKSLNIGFIDFMERNPEKDDFIIRFDDQKYASWEPFSKVFGITELVTFATKIPRALAVKLTRICEDEGETPSWRIRLLIQDYLMEQIKDRVRRVLFEG